MKINEVIVENQLNEGPLDFLKKRAANRQAAQQQAQQKAKQQATQQSARPWIEKWNQAVDANPELSSDTEALKNYATNLSRGRNGQPIITVPQPTDMSANGVSEYLVKVVNLIHAAMSGIVPTGTTQQPQSQPQQQEKPTQQPETDWSKYDQPAAQRRQATTRSTSVHKEYHPSSTAPIDPKLLGDNQVQVAGHGIMTKGPDGQWRDEQEDVITRPSDVQELNRRLDQRLQTKQMARPQQPFQPGAIRRPRSKKGRRK